MAPVSNRSKSGAWPEPQRDHLAHLPGEDGWPILCNTFAALEDPVRHIQVMHAKHGPVYRAALLREPLSAARSG